MESEHELNVGDLVAVIKRRRWMIVGVAVPIVVAGAVFSLALPDVYRSTATFRLVTDRIQEAGERAEFADQYVFALTDKVFAGDKPGEIVRELVPYPRLAEKPDVARAKLRSDTSVAMVTQSVLEPGSGRERILNVGFTVGYQNRSPEMAEEGARALTQVFLDAGRADLLVSAAGRKQFYSGEVERVAQDIANFENRLADFKSANYDRLPEAAQANFANRGRLEQELDGVEREVRTLRQNRVFVAQQLAQAQVGPGAGNLQQLEEEYDRKSAVYSETHPDLVALRRQIESLRRGGMVTTGNSLEAQLEQQRAVLAEAQQRYSPDHPDMRRLNRTIESLEERIAAGEGSGARAAADTLMSVQLRTQLNAIDTQIAGLDGRAGALRAKLNQVDLQLGSTPEVEREYQQITRGLDSAREQYNQMIARRMDVEVEIAAINNGAADKFTLFAPPGTPYEPAGPPRLGILIVSVLLAGMLAMSAVVAREVLDSRVRGARDVRGVFGSAPLAVVPEIRNSVYQRRRKRRITFLASSILIGTPALVVVVRLATT